MVLAVSVPRVSKGNEMFLAIRDETVVSARHEFEADLRCQAGLNAEVDPDLTAPDAVEADGFEPSYNTHLVIMQARSVKDAACLRPLSLEVLQKGKVTTQTPQISPYLFWYEAPHPVRFAQLAFG